LEKRRRTGRLKESIHELINRFIMDEYFHLKTIVASIVYSFIGIFILVLTFVVIELITPENLWKEILEKQNKALAIMAAAFMLAIAIIIGMAIHG
jgi:putative membrane protein